MAKTLAQATKRPNNIGNAVPAPVVPVSPPPVATTIPRNLPGLSPSTHGPTPSVWTTQYDSVKQFYRPGTSQQRFPPLPTKANPQLNAASASVAKTIVATAIAAIPAAPPAAAPVTDGLIHGTTPWEIDPSAVLWNEDFTTSRAAINSLTTSPYVGTSSAWINIATTNGLSGQSAYSILPGHIGVLQFYNATGTQNAVNQFVPTSAATTPLGDEANPSLLALLDYPGWKMTWVFGFSRFAVAGSGPTAAAFTLAHTTTYVGLASSWAAGNTSPVWGYRPFIFLGLRYDTDPGVSGMAVTTVAAPSAGSSVYTGTFPLGTTNYFIGNRITITGCAAANNNGTFLCVGSSATTLSLVNPASTVASAQTGSASQPSIGDSTFKFEWVANPINNNAAINRNNTQGVVVDTAIIPTENVFYRLDLECTEVGIVQLTLSGNGQQFTQSMTTSQVGFGTTSTTGVQWGSVTNGYVEAQSVGSFVYDGVNIMESVFASNSLITVTNPPAGLPTSPLAFYPAGTENFFFPAVSVSSGNKNSVLTGYPGLWPFFAWGNDSAAGAPTTTGRAWNLDFFGLAYNPGLNGAAVNANYSRYFAGT